MALLVSAADIIPKLVRWLWTHRVPFGKVTVLDGRPGLGKSAITIDAAARVTTGRPMPGDTTPAAAPGNVLIVTAEDDWEDTVVPRLMAAGADLSRVFRLDDLVIPGGVSVLEERIVEVAAVLVIIDPLVAFVPSKFNLYRDQDARAALKPLAEVAGRTGAAIVGLRHVSKMQGIPAQDRGTGSVAIGGAARSNLIAGPDPDREGHFVLASIKNNLGPKASSVGYSLEASAVELGDGSASVVFVRWEGEVHVDADDLVVAERQGEALSFLLEQLADGPKASNTIREAAEARGLSWTGAVRRASKRLHVVKKPPAVGVKGSEWMWRLRDR
jgi:putative DNA primase/helicase